MRNSTKPKKIKFQVQLGAGFGQQNHVFLNTSPVQSHYTIGLDHIANLSCLTSGTEIITKNGPQPVEMLTIGTRVLTRDHGYSPLKAVGKISLTAKDFAYAPSLKSVEIPTGMVGNTAALKVSESQQVLFQNEKARILFDAPKVRVEAKSCIGYCGTDYSHQSASLTYFVLVFEDHVAFKANGAWLVSEICDKHIENCGNRISWQDQTGIKPKRMRQAELSEPLLNRYETRLLFGRRSIAKLGLSLDLAA